MPSRRPARLALVVASMLAGGTAVAGATSVGVSTGLLATASKTITHATCTLTGTSQTVDTYVEEAHTANTHAAGTSLLVSAANTAHDRVYISFSLSNCATTIQNAEVDSATLTLTIPAAASTPRTLKFYRVSASWTSGINWNTKPATAASASTSLTLTSAAPGTQTIDLTTDVNDFAQSAPTVLPPYSSTVSNFGWMIDDEGSATAPVSINSSEATSNKPILTITYGY